MAGDARAHGQWARVPVVVTGGAGFLGSVLVRMLREAGADVFVPRRRNYDLTDRRAAARVYADARPRVLFHLAATVGGIGANRANPGRFFFENMAMGLNVLEEGRRYAHLDKLVIVGTTCSYPAEAPVPFSEGDLWAGYPEPTNAPYGVAKRALLVMAQAYRQQYGMRCIYLIPANLYGPGDSFDLEASHVIPALVRKCVEAVEAGAQEIVAWGDGTPTREFLHVRDCARGLMLAAEEYDGRDPVNLGTGQEIAIAELVRMIADLVGFQGRIVWDASKPGGQRRRRLDVSRAREAFRFVATVPLIEGLRETIEWYRASRGATAPAGGRE